VPTSAAQADDFDICQNNTIPDQADHLGSELARYEVPLEEVLRASPVPGLERGWQTRIGRFQFVLGRELGIYWYGFQGDDEFIVPRDGTGNDLEIVAMKTVGFDLPILEYRPFRSFSGFQSSSLYFQLFVGADVPYNEKVEAPPGAASPDLGTVWSLGLRMVFDYRYYW